MKTNTYLYGDDVEVPEVPADIIVRRVELLRDNLDELLKVHYADRDGKRCNDIIKAIKFWGSIR